jgi:putative phage-type endonuclease
MPDIFSSITGITAERAFSFSEDPELKDPVKKEEWLNFRRTGIGASDISAIAGINPWHSRIDVYLDKKGLSAPVNSEKMKWGNLLEEPVADEFAAREGVKVMRVNAILRDKKTPFLLTSLDRVIRQNGTAHEIFQHGQGALEVKTTGWAQSWEGGHLPAYYFAQLQWELHVSGLKWGRFATLIGGQDLLITPVIMADKAIGEKLQYLAEKFWNDYVLKNIVPEPASPADYESIQKVFDRDLGTTIKLPEAFERVLATHVALKQQIDDLEGKRKLLGAQILHAVGNNKYGIGQGFKVTKVIKADLRLNSALVKEKYPEIWAECSQSSQSIYPLVKAIK